jgi:hypothetical protein
MPNGFAYPIIYVRGFAGGTSGIDTATDDPFYGFNDGATHVRVNGNGNPQFHQFEGPLVRLMEDEDYRVPVHGNPIASAPLTPDAPGGLTFTIPLPSAGRPLLGNRAALALNVELLS